MTITKGILCLKCQRRTLRRKGKSEETRKAWADVLADEFLVPIVDRDRQEATDTGDDDEDVVVVGRALVRLMQPRRKKPYSQDLARVERVLGRFLSLWS
jgi:hypothetical protein